MNKYIDAVQIEVAIQGRDVQTFTVVTEKGAKVTWEDFLANWEKDGMGAAYEKGVDNNDGNIRLTINERVMYISSNDLQSLSISPVYYLNLPD